MSTGENAAVETVAQPALDELVPDVEVDLHRAARLERPDVDVHVEVEAVRPVDGLGVPAPADLAEHLDELPRPVVPEADEEHEHVDDEELEEEAALVGVLLEPVDHVEVVDVRDDRLDRVADDADGEVEEHAGPGDGRELVVERLEALHGDVRHVVVELERRAGVEPGEEEDKAGVLEDRRVAGDLVLLEEGGELLLGRVRDAEGERRELERQDHVGSREVERPLEVVVDVEEDVAEEEVAKDKDEAEVGGGARGAEAHDEVDGDGGEEDGDGLHAKEEVGHQQAEADVDGVLERRVVGEEAEGEADGDRDERVEAVLHLVGGDAARQTGRGDLIASAVDWSRSSSGVWDEKKRKAIGLGDDLHQPRFVCRRQKPGSLDACARLAPGAAAFFAALGTCRGSVRGFSLTF